MSSDLSNTALATIARATTATTHKHCEQGHKRRLGISPLSQRWLFFYTRNDLWRVVVFVLPTL